MSREDSLETVGAAYLDNEHYIFDVVGSLELKEIPKLYEYISQNDGFHDNLN